MLKIHFLNVGHGDCTLIEFPSGRITLIDINNSKVLDEKTTEELYSNFDFSKENRPQGVTDIELFERKIHNFSVPIDPIDYIYENIGNYTHIFRFILTHPDMDHMSGLYKLKDENIDIINFWDTDNTKDISRDQISNRFDYKDWETYQELRISNEEPKVLRLLKGSQNDFFNEDKIKILSPTQDIINRANERENWNLLSYVILIEYAGHKIVLGGDADAEVWDNLAESDKDLIENISILKASHHGRNSGYSQKAVSIMQPDWTICSVGKKPAQDSHNKYNHYTKEKVLSTRFRGNIVAEISSDGDLKMYCENNYEDHENLYPLNNTFAFD
ncbi:ComEC/Rec2 family competence protein [Bacillus sp. Hm123]|uniref:ComEC/Rec2 family competence protein n=1 Tax=Bacillus sp. Hm123 TaxID=3450745 RepID=UPI003F43DE46